MLPIWRKLPQVARGLHSGIQSTQPALDIPLYIFGQTGYSGMESVWKKNSAMEGVQGGLSEMSVPEARRVMSLAIEYQSQGPSIHGLQENYSLSDLNSEEEVKTMDACSIQDVHSPVYEGMTCHVSLHSCMQSNVPHPMNSSSGVYGGYSSYLNMPGGGNRLLDKYLSGKNQYYHPSRNISTSSRCNVSKQGTQRSYIDEFLSDPSVQGIQGDDCVGFKLWMENCQRYHLPNCDEQLESIKSGRKSLAQVFLEQQEIIAQVAADHKKQMAAEYNKQRPNSSSSETDAQGVQTSSYNFEFSMTDPCPQGLQGDDCANFKFWAHNCQAFGFGDCTDKLTQVQTGRRTLQDIFNEQDKRILQIVHDYQQKRRYSTSANSPNPEVGSTTKSNSSPSQSALPTNSSNKLSQKDKLKRAVKDYGSTVIVFHIGISLISLGGFYVAVTSGLDVVGILTKLGVGESILQSKLATGSTTFVMAYAVHKVFAPARIAITLSCTPFIVRHLRKIGFLKPPKST